MAILIKITTVDSVFVDVEFNMASQRWNELRIRRCSVRSVSLLNEDNGVELIFGDTDKFTLEYQYVEDVNGTNPQTNEELYNLLKVLM